MLFIAFKKISPLRLLLVGLAVWAGLLLPNLPAKAQESMVYFVQLGAFSKAPTGKLAQVADLGSIYSEPATKTLQRYLLGTFSTRSEAETAMAKVRQRGFADAFIVERTTATSPTIYDAIETTRPSQTTPKPATTGGKAFMVQVGAYGAKIPMNDIIALVTNGNIYAETTDGLTKVYIGAFASQKAAANVLRNAKAAGFKNAFVREVSLASVKLLVEQRDGVPQVVSTTMPGTAEIGFVTPLLEANPGEIATLSGNIIPINENELLFNGYLRSPNSMYSQLLLLYSNNGGKTWQESLAGDYGYVIDYVEFLDEQIAFLATFGVVEGPGYLTLYKSNNGGKTWKPINEIPKNEHYCVPSYLRMTDLLTGTAVYGCDDDNKHHLWSTTDGGVTWIYKGNMSDNAFKNLPVHSVTSANNIYTTLDNNTFIKQFETEDAYIFYRFIATDRKWEEVFRMNKQYKLNNQNLPQGL